MRKMQALIMLTTMLSLSSLIIISTQEKQFSSKSLSQCNSKNNSSDMTANCYASMIIDIPTKDITKEISDLEKTEVFKIRCHVVAHKVGGLLAEKYTIEKLIKDKVDLNLCSQGLLHGFLEGVGKSGDTDKLVSVAVKLCGQDEPTGCIHGAGHALADTKISITKAGDICLKLTPRLRDQEKVKSLSSFYYNVNCIGGYIMQDTINQPLKYNELKSENFPGDCLLKDNSLRYGCFFAYYRIYAKQPLGKGNREVGKTGFTENDSRHDLKLDEFKKYCNTLPQEALHECYKYSGMTLADVYNYDRKPNLISPIVQKYCEVNLECLTGYFEILTSQLGSQSQGYFKDFCTLDICESALKATLEKYSLQKPQPQN